MTRPPLPRRRHQGRLDQKLKEQEDEAESRGQFNKEITLVIYKSDHCFYNRRRKRV